jgi:hypothetical protein
MGASIYLSLANHSHLHQPAAELILKPDGKQKKRGNWGDILFDVEHCVPETVDIETPPLSMVNGNEVEAFTACRTSNG